jgi:hypothetical protein
MSPAPNPKPWGTTSGPYPFTYLTRAALPGAYTTASIALRVTGACKPLLQVKIVGLAEALNYASKRIGRIIFPYVSIFLVNLLISRKKALFLETTNVNVALSKLNAPLLES